MTENKRIVRIGRLDTVGHVVTELGRVYRLARRGEIDMGDAKSLTYVLCEIRCALEAGDVERQQRIRSSKSCKQQTRAQVS